MSDYNAPARLTRYTEILRGVPDDESIKELAARNEQRRQAAIAELGSRWLGFNHRRAWNGDLEPVTP